MNILANNYMDILVDHTNCKILMKVRSLIYFKRLFMPNVIHNLHQIIFSVIDALNDDLTNAENPKNRDRASQLVNNLDPNFIISTMFMADLMYILTKMIKI